MQTLCRKYLYFSFRISSLSLISFHDIFTSLNPYQNPTPADYHLSSLKSLHFSFWINHETPHPQIPTLPLLPLNPPSITTTRPNKKNDHPPHLLLQLRPLEGHPG